jgi:hypothetical protein
MNDNAECGASRQCLMHSLYAYLDASSNVIGASPAELVAPAVLALMAQLAHLAAILTEHSSHCSASQEVVQHQILQFSYL